MTKEKIKWEDIEKPPMPDSIILGMVAFGVVWIIILLMVLG